MPEERRSSSRSKVIGVAGAGLLAVLGGISLSQYRESQRPAWKESAYNAAFAQAREDNMIDIHDKAHPLYWGVTLDLNHQSLTRYALGEQRIVPDVVALVDPKNIPWLNKLGISTVREYQDALAEGTVPEELVQIYVTRGISKKLQYDPSMQNALHRSISPKYPLTVSKSASEDEMIGGGASYQNLLR